MLELARADPDWAYPGSRSHFRAYVRRVRQELDQAQAAADVPVRFEGLPAEYLQVDWGEVRRLPLRPPGAGHALLPGLPAEVLAAGRGCASPTEMRQETLFRGLVDCFCALGWVPWVLVFDNMKTVTSGRDAQTSRSGRRPCCSWRPSSASTRRPAGPGRATRRGASSRWSSGSRAISWPGGTFADDADLAAAGRRLAGVRQRPALAGDGRAAAARLAEEAAQGGPLPATAAGGDYGFLHPGRVHAEALVAVLGNQYSVPVAHVGAPVAVRVHRERVVLWRDALLVADHARAPDGAHRRVVDPAHFAPLFPASPAPR